MTYPAAQSKFGCNCSDRDIHRISTNRWASETLTLRVAHSSTRPEAPWVKAPSKPRSLASSSSKLQTTNQLADLRFSAVKGHISDMGVFPNRKFRSSAESGTIAARYRVMLAKRPFLLFGLPFMGIIIAGSFVLTPATAIRYERQDRRVRQMSREEELGVGKSGRRVDLREEYYVRFPASVCLPAL